MLQWMHYLYFICLIELMAIQSRDKVVRLEQSTENVKLKWVQTCRVLRVGDGRCMVGGLEET